MPMHDWTRVEAGIFHDFHHEWISEIKRALNRGLLPPECYALAEPSTVGLRHDVIALQDRRGSDDTIGGAATKTEHVCGLRQRRASRVAVRHVSDDRIVAMIEIVSPANEPLTLVSYDSSDPVRAFIETLAVGDPLPEMPLYLAPEFYIRLPLEAMYQAAWDTVPARWQRVIAPTP
jgi:hypothetical protein